jgi:type I restriction enzyme, S subunit
MTLPNYPKYKSSGVEWLGEVPSHWEVLSIKRLTPVQRGASPRPIDDPKYFDDEGEYAWVRIADVSASNGVLTETTQRLSELGSNLSVKLKPGELFVSIAGTVGKPCISAIKACIHDGFVYFPNLKVPPHFLFRIFEAGLCYSGLGKWGTQLNLNTDTIGSIKIALPPADEITPVLNFIDHETSKIDALIAQQENLLNLLAEKRQATISHVVTRGLNRDVPMKDSGVAWLGDVPEHWEVYPLKRKLAFLTSGSRGWAEHYADDGALFIRIGNLTRDSVRLDLADIQRVAVPAGSEGERTRVKPGDVLFSITAYLGSVAVVPDDIEEAFVSQHVALARLLDGTVLPSWVGYVALSSVGKTYLETQGYGGTKVQLSLEDVANMLLTVPPPEEQSAIVSFINEEIARIDSLRTEAVRAIELLKERRAALIAAAVTGKIDVRNAAMQELAA